MMSFVTKTYSILLFMMVAFPKSFMIMKILFLLPIVLFVIIRILESNVSIKWKYFLFYIAYVFLALAWIFIGQVHGNSSTAFFDFLRLYVVFFLIYMLFFIGLEEFDYINLFLVVVCYSSIVICAVNAVLFMQLFMGKELLPSFISSQLGVGVDINAGDLRSGLNNITSLFYITPIILCLLIFENSFAKERRVLLFIAALCCFSTSIASGRRVLMFLMLISPLLYVFFRCYFESYKGKLPHLKMNLKLLVVIYVLPASLFVYLFIYFQFDISALEQRILSLYDASSQNERVTQFYALLEGFYERPSFGHGLGSVSSVIRSGERPWSYELTYMKMLFDGGIIGFLLVATLVFYYFNAAYQNIRKFKHRMSESYVILFGILIFFVASATNPYFSGFDTLYLLCFLPLLSVSSRYNKE